MTEEREREMELMAEGRKERDERMVRKTGNSDWS